MVPDEPGGAADGEARRAAADAPTTVRELTTDAEWDAAVPLLRQLWSDADPGVVRSWRDEDGYHLFGLYVRDPGPETLVGVVGVSVQRVLHHRRHAWIHDLVVDEPRRSEEFGAELLAFVERWATERGCEYVALAAHRDNGAALRFYEAAGMERWGHVVEREL
jgi:GNAT superfamily N-acetyltransferase